VGMHAVLRFSSQFRAAGAKPEYLIDRVGDTARLGDLLAVAEEENPELGPVLAENTLEGGAPFLLFRAGERTVTLDTELADDAVIEVFAPFCGG
jgi:molybdopterin converting factor small subunit